MATNTDNSSFGDLNNNIILSDLDYFESEIKRFMKEQ